MSKTIHKEKVFGFRIPDNIHSLVKSVSDARGESISTFLRRIVLEELARLSYLDAFQKKALGVSSTSIENTTQEEGVVAE